MCMSSYSPTCLQSMSPAYLDCQRRISYLHIDTVRKCTMPYYAYHMRAPSPASQVAINLRTPVSIASSNILFGPLSCYFELWMEL